MVSLKDLIDKAIVDGDKRLVGVCHCGWEKARDIGDIWYHCTRCGYATWECGFENYYGK